jgi:predicted nucleic acid-binding protein
VRLFLDSSVLLAACGSTSGASRGVIDLATIYGWNLLTSAYVIGEVDSNLAELSINAAPTWHVLKTNLQLVRDVLSFPWITTFLAAKDRPILFTAAAWSDVLLTLDRKDFQDLLGNSFYHLQILKPGDFLWQQRTAGQLA